MKTKAIIITPYSDEWNVVFKKIKTILNKRLKGFIIGIEHVGSTAVPGLAAKPIIDIDIIISDKSNFDHIRDILKRLDYTFKGDMGIPGREFFERNSNKAPLTNPKGQWPEHHLYVCLQNSISLRNHLLFRDLLRSNSTMAEQYGALKKKLARQYTFDIDAYVEAKTPFIIFALKRAGMETQALPAIIDQNRNKLNKSTALEKTTVREATLNDLETLLGFEQQIIKWERPFDSTLTVEHIHYYDIEAMLSDPKSHVIIAESATEIIGSGFACIEISKPYLRHNHHAWLGFMYVAPSYRGQGVNKKIIEALKQWSVKQGVTEFRLSVYPDNHSAVQAYRKAGFTNYLLEMRMNAKER